LAPVSEARTHELRADMPLEPAVPDAEALEPIRREFEVDDEEDDNGEPS
jgi:hypothetical protein